MNKQKLVKNFKKIRVMFSQLIIGPGEQDMKLTFKIEHIIDHS